MFPSPPLLRHKSRPTLEAFGAQTNPGQTSASGSLYEYNSAMISQTTNYDGPGNLNNNGESVNHSGSNSVGETRVQPFSFACELAHGSNQVRISGFANIPELYQRIAESFSIPVSQIMYCTLDTPQVDMTKLLGNQLAFNHVIYAHTRGQTKEVQFLKSAEALGLTVSDNKAGGVYIKRISENGVLAKLLREQSNCICPGDLIECINGRSFINSRHMDVVKYLKDLPLESKIVLRLISPAKNIITGISKSQKRQTASGRQTIRISATGAEVTNALNRNQALLLCRLAETVEDFIGIADEELAQSIFDLESRSTTKEDFYELLKKQHSEFNFPPWIAEKFWMAYDLYLDGLHDPRH
ncbi:unnamed protein product [Hymenolepis diminuta]|uniref:PDZ domain-containing protein n=1 Tax=Hymenolepis diminuta TaxID=6216 RepID=A0A564YCF6_HYMDI|nr:unnamed protein product [Hymenolepis diminuta]